MRPDERDLDEEIRGHLALSARHRVERGENPEAARLGALREFGYVPAIRDSMRRVWYSRWFDALESVRLPGALPILGAAAVLGVAAGLASLVPAARAARVDVVQALRSE